RWHVKALLIRVVRTLQLEHRKEWFGWRCLPQMIDPIREGPDDVSVIYNPFLYPPFSQEIPKASVGIGNIHCPGYSTGGIKKPIQPGGPGNRLHVLPLFRVGREEPGSVG